MDRLIAVVVQFPLPLISFISFYFVNKFDCFSTKPLCTIIPNEYYILSKYSEDLLANLSLQIITPVIFKIAALLNYQSLPFPLPRAIRSFKVTMWLHIQGRRCWNEERCRTISTISRAEHTDSGILIKSFNIEWILFWTPVVLFTCKW